jgi:hypothetical protein
MPISVLGAALGVLVLAASPRPAPAAESVTPEQQSAAQQVAKAGVPLAELAPDAPGTYTVKAGDTLWGLSGLFLQRPWRWPELWGMNLEQVRNPHLILPGQLLLLTRANGQARLEVATSLAPATVQLSPQVRDAGPSVVPIAAVSPRFIEGFLNEAVIFDDDQLAAAPRIAATQEGRVLLSKGDVAYVVGDVGSQRDWRLFRQPQPLLDPDGGQILGYEANHVGTAELEREGGTNERGETVPATLRITSAKLEGNVGDRLAPLPPRDFAPHVPHPPSRPIAGRIVSVYGEAVNAGQNQIVALNKGRTDGLERGHVLALWRAGAQAIDRGQAGPPKALRLPDEQHGTLFVFRVFEKMSYALIIEVKEPVSRGDRFTQP